MLKFPLPTTLSQRMGCSEIFGQKKGGNDEIGGLAIPTKTMGRQQQHQLNVTTDYCQVWTPHQISRGQRWGNNFDDDEEVDETLKDGTFVEIKAMGRGRVNDHNIDDPHPPS
jgi:hypothetical protein